MSTIVVNPAQLRNAAKGLREVVAPELKKQVDRLGAEYRISPPGFGVALSTLEAQYNATMDYHLQNMRVAVESVNAIATGLERTALNYDNAEKVNVDMLAGAGIGDGQGWGGGWTDTGFARTFYRPLDGDGPGWGDLDQAGAWTLELIFVGLAVATATAVLAPSYTPTPITAALLVANGPSIVRASRALSAIASDLQGGAIKEFDMYAAGATAGWEDSSVVQYRKVIADVSRELSQMQAALSAAAAMLMSGFAVIGAFWIAFIAFSAPFFITVLDLTMSAIGPQAAVIEPIKEALAAIASAKWLVASGTTVTVAAAGGTMLLGLAKEFSSFQRFDAQGDRTPDLKQIKIQWTFA